MVSIVYNKVPSISNIYISSSLFSIIVLFFGNLPIGKYLKKVLTFRV